ncbi:MAG: hypothetical protein IKW06_04705 [Clostridia bacterium]|nr:hypothetical protein [Clostridia bacterium]
MYRVQKKGKAGILILLLFLCAFAIGLGVGYGNVQSKKNQTKIAAPEGSLSLEESTTAPKETTPQGKPASLPLVVEEETSAGESTYFVKSQDGTVCVFIVLENGDHRFSHKLSIELDALRETDKILFEKGITVHSKEELAALVEDFSS